MDDWSRRLEARGFPLDDLPLPAALYRPVVVHAGLAYVSGALPIRAGNLESRGRVGADLDVAEARLAAELCAANVLRAVLREVSSALRVVRLIRVAGYVQSAPGFSEQHLVLNGASEFFLDILGDRGPHARSAVGVFGLPLGASVEVDAIFAVSEVAPA